MQSGMGCSIRMMWQTAQDEKVFVFFQHHTYSWVIWSTSVTVESEGSFLSVFVFFEGQ